MFKSVPFLYFQCLVQATILSPRQLLCLITVLYLCPVQCVCTAGSQNDPAKPPWSLHLP